MLGMLSKLNMLSILTSFWCSREQVAQQQAYMLFYQKLSEELVAGEEESEAGGGASSQMAPSPTEETGSAAEEAGSASGFREAALTCGVAELDGTCTAMCWLAGPANGSGDKVRATHGVALGVQSVQQSDKSSAVAEGVSQMQLETSQAHHSASPADKLYTFSFDSRSVELRLSDLVCDDVHPDMVDYNTKVLQGSYLGMSEPVTTICNVPGLLSSARGVERLLLLEAHSDIHVKWESRTSIAGNRMKLVGSRDWHTGFEKYDLTATGSVKNKEQRNHTLLVEGSAFVKEWIPHTEAIKGDDDSIGAVFLVSLLRCAEATI